MKVHVIFLYTQPFTHKLHLKMGLGPFLEQSSTVKFSSLFEPPKAAIECTWMRELDGADKDLPGEHMKIINDKRAKEKEKNNKK